MSALAEQIIDQQFTHDAAGKRIAGSSFISRAQGQALTELIRSDASILKTMEIGCAQGVSSLFICDALKGRPDARHTIVDPFQETDWRGAGRAALKREGHDNYDFVEELSEILLPRWVQEERRFDMIFVDGNHSFEHALFDMIFSTKLLRTGGYLAVDDTGIPPVAKAFRYVEQFPCYEVVRKVHAWPQSPGLAMLAKIGSVIPMSPNMLTRLPYKSHGFFRKPRMIILRKVAEDQRYWRRYKPF
ncbi:class I SAM-dependent methyltransferase [Brevundimonas sp.]|uniref:class I SAM-dependent methyltransferase n=1 Tax=Brevundimonas sp. TaxID=1871086 RepID=UPI002FD9BE48